MASSCSKFGATDSRVSWFLLVCLLCTGCSSNGGDTDLDGGNDLDAADDTSDGGGDLDGAEDTSDGGGDLDATDDTGIPPGCGNSVEDPDEECDEGGATATCDIDCTLPECGDGLINTAAGEQCEGGSGCDSSCQIVAAPDFIADQTLVIPENAVAGDTVGHAKPYPTMTLQSPSFAISGGNANGLFAIDDATGLITVGSGATFDAAATPSHDLTVTVDDGRLGTDVAVVTVNVLDAADTVFIDPTNTDDPAQDGTREHPFDSFDDFGYEASHSYLFKRGTTMTFSEAEELGVSDLLLGAYGSGERPLLHCTGSDVQVLYNWNGPQNVTIRDLDVYAPNGTSSIRFGGETGDNGTIDNCVVHGGTWGIRAFSPGLRVFYTEVYDIGDDGMFIQDVNGLELAYNYVHDVNTHWVPPYTPQTEAAGDGIQLSNCNGWHVHHNLIDRTNSGNKFCFIANNPAQDDGLLEHNRMLGPLTDGDGGAGIYMHDGTGMIIRYNIVEGPNPGAFYSHAVNLLIYGNIFTGGGRAIYASGSAQVFNNVFHELPTGFDGGTIEARNNIFALGADGTPFGAVTNLTESHNLFADGGASASSIDGDPRFVDAASGDFHLLEGSDAIDTGVDVGITHDMNGVPIPQGSAPDIGAFESVQ